MSDDLILHKAKLALIEAENAKKKEDSTKFVDDLDEALNNLEGALDLIPVEVAKLEKAIERIKEKKDTDEKWEVKAKYFEWQIDVIKETYPKFHAEGKRRRALIDRINRTGMWASEKKKCQKDTHYWFENYAWTADPRKEGLWALPFNLYPFQKRAVDWLEDYIFTIKTDCGIEKSRDMGLSWLITALFYKHFQHSVGFHALMGSITADECDTINDPSTLFEKLRIQARLQPKGLLPSGWDREISYMKAFNPQTGSTITGSTSNDDFGRGGRYKVILFDELASFEQDTGALTASSQSAPCRIFNSTVKGMGNEFARIRHENTVDFLTLHWKDHPFKDSRWYNYEGGIRMTPVAVAQELDIDYSASQPNKVYPKWDEVYHTITVSELLTALPEFKDSRGQFQIPQGTKIVMGEDVGQSQSKNALLWFLTLKQGSVTRDGIDLSGSVICYREHIMPQHSTIRQNSRMIRDLESRFESRMITERYISHEGRWAVDNYEEHGIFYTQWRTDQGGNEGVSTIRDYLEVLNKREPHPFRDLSRRTKFKDKAPIMGRPKIYFLCEDDQAELLYDDTLKKYRISPPVDELGMKNTREEFPKYHYPSTEYGKEQKRMRPRKISDDCMDIIRCVARESFAPVGDITFEDKVESQLPNTLKLGNIETLPPEQLGMAFLQRQSALESIKQSEQNKLKLWRYKVMEKIQ